MIKSDINDIIRPTWRCWRSTVSTGHGLTSIRDRGKSSTLGPLSTRHLAVADDGLLHWLVPHPWWALCERSWCLSWVLLQAIDCMSFSPPFVDSYRFILDSFIVTVCCSIVTADNNINQSLEQWMEYKKHVWDTNNATRTWWAFCAHSGLFYRQCLLGGAAPAQFYGRIAQARRFSLGLFLSTWCIDLWADCGGIWTFLSWRFALCCL